MAEHARDAAGSGDGAAELPPPSSLRPSLPRTNPTALPSSETSFHSLLVGRLVALGLSDGNAAALIEAELNDYLVGSLPTEIEERVVRRAIEVRGGDGRPTGGRRDGDGHEGDRGRLGQDEIQAAGTSAPAREAADSDIVVVSDDEVELPAADTAAAAARSTSTAGTHLQTAEDLLRSSPLSPFAGPPPARPQGMPHAPSPSALTYPLPPTADTPLTAEVFLIVDDRETVGRGPTRDAFLARLSVNPGLANRVVRRRLPTGDAVLVARVTAAGEATVEGAPPAGTELMLDHVIERKTAADVFASLRDGRLREQTYYMAASGCKSLTCVVEGDINAVTDTDATMQAEAKNFLAELAVSSGFFIKYAEDLTDTAAYFSALVRVHSRRLGSAVGLKSWLTARRGTGGAADDNHTCLTFSMWEWYVREMRGATTLQQIWAMQLDTLPGVGPARINSIVDGGFNVPAVLQTAYRAAATEEEGKLVLARMVPPPGRAPVTRALSEFVYLLFTMDEYVRR